MYLKICALLQQEHKVVECLQFNWEYFMSTHQIKWCHHHHHFHNQQLFTFLLDKLNSCCTKLKTWSRNRTTQGSGGKAYQKRKMGTVCVHVHIKSSSLIRVKRIKVYKAFRHTPNHWVLEQPHKSWEPHSSQPSIEPHY